MKELFDDGKVNQILAIIKDELRSATLANGSMASPHEGWAVIYEELDELWDEVKRRHPDRVAMLKEAVQTAAMATRFLHDLVYDKDTAISAGYAVTPH